MEIKKIVNPENDENTYILINGTEKAVIDPGCDCEKIISSVGENIKYILLTHCHFDHIESLKELKEKTGAKIVFSKVGESNLNNEKVNLSGMVYGKNIGTDADILVSEGDILSLNDENIKVIETPGHTSCGVCYLTGETLFSGDTLFLNSIGRCDFPTGNFSILESSIKRKIYTLDENIEVYPGHGEKTTVGYEKKYNSFVRG